ncbi:Hypothetical protein GSB_153052 [Giardia duodenalis]|uniref:Uncharacterized protein n=1 Tax=Giardia intestinalis TaxID=5741 RepID=V6TW21_GIAIN|nr:Hypothetical protein GSB_153052 [Giardia intestinalis]
MESEYAFLAEARDIDAPSLLSIASAVFVDFFRHGEAGLLGQ